MCYFPDTLHTSKFTLKLIIMNIQRYRTFQILFICMTCIQILKTSSMTKHLNRQTWKSLFPQVFQRSVLTQWELVGLCSSEIPRPVKSKGTTKNTLRRRNKDFIEGHILKTCNSRRFQTRANAKVDLIHGFQELDTQILKYPVASSLKKVGLSDFSQLL